MVCVVCSSCLLCDLVGMRLCWWTKQHDYMVSCLAWLLGGRFEGCICCELNVGAGDSLLLVDGMLSLKMLEQLGKSSGDVSCIPFPVPPGAT